MIYSRDFLRAFSPVTHNAQKLG